MTAPRIVLLDNDPAALSLLHELLTDQGYRTLRCRPDDVVSAHALMKRARPALVILDLWSAKREGGRAFLTHLWGDGETAYMAQCYGSCQRVFWNSHTPLARRPIRLVRYCTRGVLLLEAVAARLSRRSPGGYQWISSTDSLVMMPTRPATSCSSAVI